MIEVIWTKDNEIVQKVLNTLLFDRSLTSSSLRIAYKNRIIIQAKISY